MNYQQDHFPGFDCDEDGNVYHDNQLVQPFKSNKYLQVCQFDTEHKKHIVGVHTVVAMKYLDYVHGCVVHHIDENCHNNSLSNLMIMTRSEHSRYHENKDPNNKLRCIGRTPWNKGLKMSEEFCQHCSEAAKRRHNKQTN